MVLHLLFCFGVVGAVVEFGICLPPVWDCQLNMPIMPAREGLAEARVSLCCKGPSCAWMGQVRSSTPRQGKRTWSFWDVHPATWNMNCFKLATASQPPSCKASQVSLKCSGLGSRVQAERQRWKSRDAWWHLFASSWETQASLAQLGFICTTENLRLLSAMWQFFCRNLGLSRRMKLQFTLTGWIWCVASWLPLVWVALVATSGVRGCWHQSLT